MQFRNQKPLESPTAAALWLASRIKPVRLGQRVADQVETSDFRSAALLCRRALGAGRALSPTWNPEANGRDEEQRYWLRQLLSLVEDLRVKQRRGPHSQRA